MSPPSLPAAELDRRFYAFALDRAITWGPAALVVSLGYRAGGAHPILVSLGAGVATLLVVGGALAVLLGLRGATPGMSAASVRTVDVGVGSPIGVGRALLRQLVLGVAGLPTFGMGLAALAWTAVMDPSGRRRGWHDLRAHSIVVDARPVEVEEPVVDDGPRSIVNLTAMRLVPAAPVPPPVTSAPPRTARPAAPPPAAPPAAPPPAAPAVPEPALAATGRHAATPMPDAPPAGRQRLGYPLLPDPPRADSVHPPGHSTAERTVLRGERPGMPARWRVSFDSGESFVVEGLALVGRRPEPRKGEPVRHVVPLRSDDLSLSKTHAQFQVAADGVLVVMDRGSTNGSILFRQGVPRELSAGRPATLVDGDRVRFGDREMVVRRDA